MRKLPVWRAPWGANKIIEIGGGHNPFAGVTHAVEKYPLDNTQRGGNFTLPDGAKFFQGDLESLPFTDNEKFDFLYASHVFEHVNDPIKAGKEINRLTQKGYIETPSPLREQLACPIPFNKQNDFHLYFCWNTKNAMHFVRKSTATIGQFTNNPAGQLAQSLFKIQREEGISLEPILPKHAKTTTLYFNAPLKIYIHKDFFEAERNGFCAYENSIKHLRFFSTFPMLLISERFRRLKKILTERELA